MTDTEDEVSVSPSFAPEEERPAWTRTKPVLDGYYWARSLRKVTTKQWEEFIEIVQVSGGWANACGDDAGDPLDRFTHWIGPLGVPQSPE